MSSKMASPAFQALAASLCLAPGCTSASIPCGGDQAANHRVALAVPGASTRVVRLTVE